MDIFNDANYLVLVSIAAVVLLLFVLLIIVYTIKIRSINQKSIDMQNRLDQSIERADLMEESLNEVRRLNSIQLDEINGNDKSKEKLNREIKKLKHEVQVKTDEAVISQNMLDGLIRDKNEFDKNIKEMQEVLDKHEKSLDVANKRNEFWVEQMTELRTKYEALRLKLK